MSAHDTAPATDTDAITALLRGEIAAVEAYDQAIGTFDKQPVGTDLIRPDADGRFPAIIEYIPYRKDDLSQGGYDAHYYFAERGFVGVRLDDTVAEAG